MFEPFLSCKAFGLVEGPPNAHVLLARWWSGQDSLSEDADGFVHWESETTLDIGGEIWLASPPRMEFPAHNALIQLGDMGDGVRAFAFVSPLPVVTASFRSAVSRYFARERPGSSVVELKLQLNLVAKNAGKFVIRSIEGIDQSGLHAILSAPSSISPTGIKSPPQLTGINSPPQLKEYYAIEIVVHQHTARLDPHYNIKLSDISVEPLEVHRCLGEVFYILHEYTVRQNSATSKRAD